ncbi:hypothetical protein EYF80_023176 [Liparis tanakae]|uniref:Uncharacterized protein n=1 Tax=Liparis tanakae TaxID=230148 RepID=A0A4Z2HPD6_9TELE|nr:hypothetical protein EYF80_023176 [Liparis tanakae]
MKLIKAREFTPLAMLGPAVSPQCPARPGVSGKAAGFTGMTQATRGAGIIRTPCRSSNICSPAITNQREELRAATNRPARADVSGYRDHLGKSWPPGRTSCPPKTGVEVRGQSFMVERVGVGTCALWNFVEFGCHHGNHNGAGRSQSLASDLPLKEGNLGEGERNMFEQSEKDQREQRVDTSSTLTPAPGFSAEPES